MPDIKVIKLKLRRGLESQRSLVTFDQGELGYTIDTKRVFVGDGATTGGILVGTKAFTPIPINKTALKAYQGDLVVENSLLYQLTGTDATMLSSWGYIGTRIDNDTLKFDSQNNLYVNRLSPSFVFVSGGISSTTLGLSARVDNSTIRINPLTNNLTVGTITRSNINMVTLVGRGITATSTGTLCAHVDYSTLVINTSTNRISVGTITSQNISVSTLAGPGLSVTANGTLSANVDNASITSASNVISLSSLYNASRLPLSSWGVFGGFFDQYNSTDIKQSMMGTTQYLASSGLNDSLTRSVSSAGFVIIDLGSPYGKKAIPIFDIPSEIMDIS